MRVRSPKQVSTTDSRAEQKWYRYYAGYRQCFVDDILSRFALAPGQHVVDPWNGSGTTTTRAAAAGLAATGIDANPVLVVVARGRVLGCSVIDSLTALTDEIVDVARAHDFHYPSDPLQDWFDSKTAENLRRYEWAIQHVLVDHNVYKPICERGVLGVSALAAFMYVALFGATRSLLAPYAGTNPTWIRRRTRDEKIKVEPAAICRSFTAECKRLESYLRSQRFDGAVAERAKSLLGHSESCSFGASGFDALIASPPYCTRIDYAIATAPELALLGYRSTAVAQLRHRLLGTPTISSSQSHDIEVGWGPKVTETLAAIGQHKSKASATYYLRYYTQYFSSLWQSIRNFSRQAQDQSKMCLVVQGSYYKEVPVDLSRIVKEMAERNGWKTWEIIRFKLLTTKAAMNPKARKYRSNFQTSEDALLFKRSG